MTFYGHVKSEDNPADPLSREIDAEKIELMKLWWEGPNFLHHNTPLYVFKPRSTFKDIPEARVISLVAQDATVKLDSNIIQKFSSLSRIKTCHRLLFTFQG